MSESEIAIDVFNRDVSTGRVPMRTLPKKWRRPIARYIRNWKRTDDKERDEWIAQQLAKEEGDQ